MQIRFFVFFKKLTAVNRAETLEVQKMSSPDGAPEEILTSNP